MGFPVIPDHFPEEENKVRKKFNGIFARRACVGLRGIDRSLFAGFRSCLFFSSLPVNPSFPVISHCK